MRQSPTARYWTTLRTELSWPFEIAESQRRRRHAPERLTRRLAAIAQTERVPFHELVRDESVHVRDALALLVVLATQPAARARANPESPFSIALPVSLLADWAADTADARTDLLEIFTSTRFEEVGLVAMHRRSDGVRLSATPELVELVTGEPWQGENGIPVKADDDAHEVVTSDFELTKLTALARSIDHPMFHLIGPKGSGRLRVAAALARRAGCHRLVVMDARALPEDLTTTHLLVEGALIESISSRARLVVTDVDDVGPSIATRVLAAARRAKSSVWTTSARNVRWTASAIAWPLPKADPELAARAWRHDAASAGLQLGDREVEALVALGLDRHSITMTSSVAARLYGARVPIDSLTEIANYFCRGAHDG